MSADGTSHEANPSPAPDAGGRAKHTPGPWMALPPAAWAGPDDQWVVPGVALCGNGELSEGNARLIASAPDLAARIERLEAACNALLGLIQLVAGRPDISDEVREALSKSHRIDEARAALGGAS